MPPIREIMLFSSLDEAVVMPPQPYLRALATWAQRTQQVTLANAAQWADSWLDLLFFDDVEFIHILPIRQQFIEAFVAQCAQN